MTEQISLKRNDWVFHTGPWFWPFVLWWKNPNAWTFRFWNFQLFGSIFHFYQGVSRYCVSCVSCAPWQSGFDIHDFFCCHLWCWWTLFGEFCIRSRIIFHNIASQYNSTFVFLVLCLQFGILQMTDVHQWSKMNFSALRPCFIDHLLFTSDFCQVPRQNLFNFLPFFIHCYLCCGYLHCLRQRKNCVQNEKYCCELFILFYNMLMMIR